MSAIVTDQFRILNANNFVASVEDTNNSYYIFIGLSNPKGTNTLVGFGRTTDWDTDTPAPTDSFAYRKHSTDTMMYGRKISSANIRRVIRRIDWVSGNKYEIYRDDYSAQNPSPNTKANSLYDANYYVLNSDFKVYVCIDNGSTGDNPTGNVSQDEPTFTDLEPSKAGSSGDGYVWKYLFTISPSDIVKFDSTEFITVPNGWSTSTDSQIRNVRENGNSNTNNNQIKHIYIENSGVGYKTGNGQEVPIIGDGIGGKARVDVVGGKITNVTVSSGGKGYTYALVDLGELRTNAVSTNAKLVPIIPPSLGHGYDIYTELGTDKVICYSRFDDTTKDFPTDTKFAQIGIVKNPTKPDSTDIFTADSYSSLQAVKLTDVSGTPKIGEVIEQVLTVSPNNGKIARGYVASFDEETKVLKYFRDRSLNFNPTQLDHTDFVGVSTDGRIFQFESAATSGVIKGNESLFTGSVEKGFTGVSTITSGNKLVNLGTNFNAGLSQSEINKGSGEVIYLDNRSLISRNERQKEDVKIILEF